MRTGADKPRLAGVELYFEDLESAKDFYTRVLGLELSEESAGRYAKFDMGTGFICLEKKGIEPYPSADKAVVFLEVDDLRKTIERIGPQRFLEASHQGDARQPWAVLHDPEKHNILLLERRSARLPAKRAKSRRKRAR